MNTKKLRKAPRVAKYNMERNFMKEYDKPPRRTSPQQPMGKKRLSK